MGRSDPKMTGTRRLQDFNNDRLNLAMACWMGQIADIRLKDNTDVRGVVASCEPEGWHRGERKEADICLTHAQHTATEHTASSGILPKLLVPGDEFEAAVLRNVPATLIDISKERSLRSRTEAGFHIDSEISKKANLGEERELERWVGENNEVNNAEIVYLEGSNDNQCNWDQFEQNQRQFGVRSTYDDNYYTTKLDMNTIPNHVQQKAIKIAQELESCSRHNVDNPIETEDEEERFSAVKGTGQYAKDLKANEPKQRMDRTNVNGESPAHGGDKKNYVPFHTSKRNNNAAKVNTDPELKGINALNLEPALPKLDESVRHEWVSLRQSNHDVGHVSPETVNSGRRFEKMQFIQEMEIIRDKMEKIGIKTSDGDTKSSHNRMNAENSSSRISPLLAGALQSAASGNTHGSGNSNGQQTNHQFNNSNIAHKNPLKKEFQFNPNANAFTPGGPSTANDQPPDHPTREQDHHPRAPNNNPSPNNNMPNNPDRVKGPSSSVQVPYVSNNVYATPGHMYDPRLAQHPYTPGSGPQAYPSNPPPSPFSPQKPTQFVCFSQNPKNKHTKLTAMLKSCLEDVGREDPKTAGYEWDRQSCISYKQVIGEFPVNHGGRGGPAFAKSGQAMHSNGHVVAYGLPHNYIATHGGMPVSSNGGNPHSTIPFQASLPPCLQVHHGAIPNQVPSAVYYPGGVPSSVRPAPNPHVSIVQNIQPHGYRSDGGGSPNSQRGGPNYYSSQQPNRGHKPNNQHNNWSNQPYHHSSTNQTNHKNYRVNSMSHGGNSGGEHSPDSSIQGPRTSHGVVQQDVGHQEREAATRLPNTAINNNNNNDSASNNKLS